MSISVVAIITSKTDADATLQIELKKLLLASLAEDGCIGYEIYECNNQKGQYIVMDQWESEDALAAHQETPHFKYFIHIAPALLANPIDIKPLTRLV